MSRDRLDGPTTFISVCFFFACLTETGRKEKLKRTMPSGDGDARAISIAKVGRQRQSDGSPQAPTGHFVFDLVYLTHITTVAQCICGTHLPLAGSLDAAGWWLNIFMARRKHVFRRDIRRGVHSSVRDRRAVSRFQVPFLGPITCQVLMESCRLWRLERLSR